MSLRRRFGAPRTTAITIALLLPVAVSVTGSQAAVGAGGAPSGVSTITSVPFTEREDLTYYPVPAASGPANRNLSASCGGGRPLYEVRWYRYTPSAATTIQASGFYYDTLGRDRFGHGSGIAILTSTQQVMECAAAPRVIAPEFEDPPSAVTKPVPLAAGKTVYLAQFITDYYVDEACGTPTGVCYDGVRSLRVSVAGAPPARPDLVVTSVTASPSAPRAGNPVTFSATVKNQGAAATPAGVVHGVAFSVDGRASTFTDSWTGAILPGQSVTLTANNGPGGVPSWRSVAGSHTVMASVDSTGRIPESNNANNTRSLALGVGSGAGLSDLVVSSLTWNPTTPVLGAPVRFTAVVTNVGAAATPLGKVVGVSFRPFGQASNATYTDVWDAPLAPGASVTLTATAGCRSGRYVPTSKGQVPVTVVVDDVNRVVESNDANNTLVAVMTVG